jgi:hypothetical protein
MTAAADTPNIALFISSSFSDPLVAALLLPIHIRCYRQSIYSVALCDEAKSTRLTLVKCCQRRATIRSAHGRHRHHRPRAGLVAIGRRAARERGGPLPSIAVADPLLDGRRELTGRPGLTSCLDKHKGGSLGVHTGHTHHNR